MEKQVLKNSEIYNLAQGIINNKILDLQFPAVIGFYIHQNCDKILKLAESIDNYRNTLLKQYSTSSNGNSYNFETEESRSVINEELEKLSNLRQEVWYHPIHLSQFENLSLTLNQMKCLSFMIDDQALKEE